MSEPVSDRELEAFLDDLYQRGVDTAPEIWDALERGGYRIVRAEAAGAPSEGLREAAERVRATLTPVPPGGGRMGFLVAPGKGRAFEKAAAELVAALAAAPSVAPRFDHDGMFRHHHDDRTDEAIWWEYADQFGGEKREHRHHHVPSVAPSESGLDVLHTWAGHIDCDPQTCTVAHLAGTAPSESGLDAAWAEAEAALPEGWQINSLIHGTTDGSIGWSAGAYHIAGTPVETNTEKVRENGMTPVAALRALAARLRQP